MKNFRILKGVVLLGFFISIHVICSSYCVRNNNKPALIQDAQIRAFTFQRDTTDPAAQTSGGQNIVNLFNDYLFELAGAAAHMSPDFRTSSPINISQGTNITTSTTLVGDGMVSFSYGGFGNPSAAAVTTVMTSGSSILEFDIAFNVLFGGTVGTTSFYDARIETVLRHEIGHGAGLMHPKCSNALMHEAAAGSLRNFTNDELFGYVCLYIGNCQNSGCTSGCDTGVQVGDIDYISFLTPGYIINGNDVIFEWNIDAERNNDIILGYNLYIKEDNYGKTKLASLNSKIISSQSNYFELCDYAADSAHEYYIEIVETKKGGMSVRNMVPFSQYLN